VNTRPGPCTARAYVYWTSSDALSPASWSAGNLSLAGNPPNWVGLSTDKAGGIMVSKVPLVWDAPTARSDVKPVLCAFIDNNNAGDAPDFTAFSWLKESMITGFVGQEPQLAWVTVDGTATAPPALGFEHGLSVPKAGGFYVGLRFTNVPADGTYGISIPGPDAANTVVVTGLHPPGANALVVWEVAWPDAFATTMVVRYQAGATPAPGAPAIVPILIAKS